MAWATTGSGTTTEAAAVCSNSEGGVCLNGLCPGQAYTTVEFTPTLSYQVPDADWFNYEDTPRNFLLVPPGNDLEGVNAGTSDFVGVSTAVAPAKITSPDGCAIDLVPGVRQTPAAMWVWFRQQPELTVGQPKAVAVGGLRGVVIDIRTRPGAKLPTCQEGHQEVAVGGLFSGISPSHLDHGTIPGVTVRLYLLAHGRRVLAVEVDDIDKTPGDLETCSQVVAASQLVP